MADFTETTDPLSQRFEFRRDLLVRGESFGGRMGYVIEDPLSGKFFHIGEPECRFLRFCDGQRTLQEVIALSSSLEFAELQISVAFSQAEALVLIRWARSRGLLVCGAGVATEDHGSSSKVNEPSQLAFNPFFIRLPLDSPHRLLESLSRWLGSVFTVWGAALFAVVWIGLIAYVAPRAHDIMRWETLWHPQNWVGLLVIWLGLKVWHELGHAVACRRFGGEIRSAGVALICFAPVAYIDATSAWRISSKWKRIVVSAAGMYLEGWAAAVAILVAAICNDESVRTWASHVALVAGGQTLLVNANPLVRFDGYYILADLLELPNLQALARQSSNNALRRLSGDSQAIDAPLVGKRRIIAAAYAWGAGMWRLCLTIGGVGFFLAQQPILGAPLAWLLAISWLALPIWMMGRDFSWMRDWKPKTDRLVAGGAMLFLLLMGGGWWLLQPAILRAEGVVDFSPMTVLRAPLPGFVGRVLVKDGEHVPADAPIVVLRNDDLEFEAIDLRLQLAQSKAKIQTLSAQQQLAKRSNEEATCRSLETRLMELEGKLADLTIRAPHAGRVIARDIEQLTGRFLAAGDEVAILGGDDRLHVVAVVSQQELVAVNRPGVQAQIDFAACRAGLSGESVRLEPAAHMSLPHEALSGVNGGPIAMRQSTAPAGSGRASYEPLSPVFVAYVRLPPTLSEAVWSGERATVRFSSPGYSRIVRLRDIAFRWFQGA
jgi:putative peptide zinc metalloprotease protein